MTARDDVLGRVRSALRQRPAAPDPTVPAVELPGAPVPDDVVGLFAERVADYRAVVVRCQAGEVAERVREGLAQSRRVVVPDGFPQEWWPDGFERVSDDPPLTSAELDHVDAVVTSATVGIAVPGTIVMDHGSGQGRRALSLVPDRHVCVVRSDQVVHDVADALTRLDAVRPMTWISGPSATSDIELDRVEGVHGPRTLHVVIVDL